jgi:hypothetical protein
MGALLALTSAIVRWSATPLEPCDDDVSGA